MLSPAGQWVKGIAEGGTQALAVSSQMASIGAVNSDISIVVVINAPNGF
jgi:hypothetical protein